MYWILICGHYRWQFQRFGQWTYPSFLHQWGETKTHWFTLHTANVLFSLCSSSQSISVSFIARDMKSHWKQQLQLIVHFLSYAHILPSISTGGWWQDRSIPGGSFEPTPWVCWSHNNHLNDNGHGCDGHLHASETWEGGPPTEREGQWKQMIQFVS